MQKLLDPSEIARVEREQAAGISSREVVRLFEAKGARLSAATFRKYVQTGLLPRSRRVGRKGKHAGSRGLYPVAVVRRIDLIKRMMAAGLTLEEIRDSYVAIRNRIEDLQAEFAAVRADLAARARAHPARNDVEVELTRAERELSAAFRRLERAGSIVATARGSELGSG
ncbi:MAG TPA: MerR family transcriptional regulator [Anaeromyxobacteraceae bacterium]|nr:MerR family transcriptional regulator [Anaeromyxobacteraceae bacterium]